MNINKIGSADISKIIIPETQKEQPSGFGELLKSFIQDVNNDLNNAKVAEEQIRSGNVENLQELVYQIEKSDISLRLITEIRNKALESYQEIIRMQV